MKKDVVVRIHCTVFVALISAAWGCNKAQRTPLREPDLLTASLAADDWKPVAPLQGQDVEDLDAVDPACSRLSAPVTRCLPPSGGTVEVGPLGATIGTTDGNFRLAIPPAALATQITLRMGPTMEPPWTSGYVSHAYDLGPEGVTFSIPATLSLSHSVDDLPANVSGGRLALHMVVGGQWRRLPASQVDGTTHLVSAPIERLGTVATLAPATGLTVSPGVATLRVGEVRQLNATTVPEGRAVSWSIVPSGIATIDSRTGLLAARAPGSARVVAASAGFIKQTGIVVLPGARERP